MKKFSVTVDIPSKVYVLEVNKEKEARQKAIEQYKIEHPNSEPYVSFSYEVEK